DLTSKGFTKHIKLNSDITAEQLKAYGFTDYSEPTLYYCRSLGNDITFNFSVGKETLEITRIDVLDENFLQPYDYQQMLMSGSDNEFAQSVYHKVNSILSKMQDDGIITGFEEGMYI